MVCERSRLGDFEMRVLQVVHGFPPRQKGGTEIYAYDLARELARQHDVYVLYPVYEGPRLFLRSASEDNMELLEMTMSSRWFHTILRSLFFARSF